MTPGWMVTSTFTPFAAPGVNARSFRLSTRQPVCGGNSSESRAGTVPAGGANPSHTLPCPPAPSNSGRNLSLTAGVRRTPHSAANSSCG